MVYYSIYKVYLITKGLFGYLIMPKRESLENLLLNDISSGRVKAGEKIPSRNMLMKKYDLSRDTVEKAVGNLIRAGVLYARQGAGTVVAQG